MHYIDRYRFLVIILITLVLIIELHRRNDFPTFFGHYKHSWYNKSEKSSKMLVVSHFDEDLTWIELFIGNKIEHIIYTRSKDSLIQNSMRINKGREAVVYLRYIVEHYDNLPSSIAFIHAHRTSWHLKDPMDIVVALRAAKWNKYDYIPLSSEKTFTEFSLDKTEQQARINLELWNAVLRSELGNPPTGKIRMHCCAEFIVRREAILKHPKEFYSKIMSYIIASQHSDYHTGRTLEYTWHLIFGQPENSFFVKCDIFFCNSMGQVSVEIAEQK